MCSNMWHVLSTFYDAMTWNPSHKTDNKTNLRSCLELSEYLGLFWIKVIEPAGVQNN